MPVSSARADARFSAQDEVFMRRALEFAFRAFGRTSPNPAVGAVVVRNGRVVGEGFHRRAGLPHAEAEALRQAKGDARGATLYVTLEPCAHHGRTPPCVDAVVASGIRRVVAAVVDPNPLVNGKGFRRLKRAGVAVDVGLLKDEARRLNAPFFKVMTERLPWTVVKIGQSLDGKIATSRGESRWITSEPARALGHEWRSRVDAILVGSRTIKRDDPRLTERSGVARHGRPIKIIVDTHLSIPPTARCLSAQSPAPTWIATLSRDVERIRRFEKKGVTVLPLRGSARVPLRPFFRLLAERGVQSVLIEGGGEVIASAFKDRLVDHVSWCVAPIFIGGREAPGSVGGEGTARLTQAVRLANVTVDRVGPDVCIAGDVVYPKRRG